MAVAVSQWHWMDRGRKAGPVSWHELQQLARCGKLKPADMVLREGTCNWQPARTAREADEGPGQAAVAGATVPRRLSVPPAEEDFDSAGLSPGGLRPVRMFIGLAMIGGGIVASVASFDSAVRKGGGKFLIFIGPMIWGAALVLTSFSRTMKRYDE